MRKHVSKEDFQHYEHALSTCTGYDDLVNRVYTKMFGVESLKQFNDFHSLSGRLNKIEFPLFGFGSHDDVIMRDSTLTVDEIEQSTKPIMVASSYKGAHVAHLTGNLLPTCWY